MKILKLTRIGIFASIGVSALGFMASAHDNLNDSSATTDKTPAWHDTHRSDVYNADSSYADIEGDRILRLYQKGKMSAEVTDMQEHQSNGQTLFPRFGRLSRDTSWSGKSQYRAASSMQTTPLPTETESTTHASTAANRNVVEKSSGTQIDEAAGADNSKMQLKSDVNSERPDFDPSNLLGGINNQDKDAQKLNHKSSKASTSDLGLSDEAPVSTSTIPESK